MGACLTKLTHVFILAMFCGRRWGLRLVHVGLGFSLYYHKWVKIVSASVWEALEHREKNLRRISGNLLVQGQVVNQLEALACQELAEGESAASNEDVMPLMY